jgi:hypothetical protein
MLKAIVSSPGAPATHSPGSAPDAVFVFAAVIASRSVHTPSLATESAALLTVIVAAFVVPAMASAINSTKLATHAWTFTMFPWMQCPACSRSVHKSALTERYLDRWIIAPPWKW